jgi:hypothetical protein
MHSDLRNFVKNNEKYIETREPQMDAQIDELVKKSIGAYQMTQILITDMAVVENCIASINKIKSGAKLMLMDTDGNIVKLSEKDAQLILTTLLNVKNIEYDTLENQLNRAGDVMDEIEKKSGLYFDDSTPEKEYGPVLDKIHEATMEIFGNKTN